ncbi:hypothetical protein [Moraxella lacunata]|uniref:hypothetical protein n=1 Tax=Moraxella lacunata TaxID=477 RepID=UPI003EDF70A5
MPSPSKSLLMDCSVAWAWWLNSANKPISAYFFMMFSCLCCLRIDYFCMCLQVAGKLFANHL